MRDSRENRREKHGIGSDKNRGKTRQGEVKTEENTKGKRSNKRERAEGGNVSERERGKKKLVFPFFVRSPPLIQPPAP